MHQFKTIFTSKYISNLPLQEHWNNGKDKAKNTINLTRKYIPNLNFSLWLELAQKKIIANNMKNNNDVNKYWEQKK